MASSLMVDSVEEVRNSSTFSPKWTIKPQLNTCHYNWSFEYTRGINTRFIDSNKRLVFRDSVLPKLTGVLIYAETPDYNTKQRLVKTDHTSKICGCSRHAFR